MLIDSPSNSLDVIRQTNLLLVVYKTATRRLAATTFAHILDLDIQYHLDRQSGALSKILDRGTVSMLMNCTEITFSAFRLD